MLANIAKFFWMHWMYLCYLMKHKYYVFKAGLFFKVGWWQLIVHDFSKFLPSEWFPYVNHFYGGIGNDLRSKRQHEPGSDTTFDYAWLLHQKRNAHHWQFWILQYDYNETWTLHCDENGARLAENNKCMTPPILMADGNYIADLLNNRPIAMEMPEKYAREMVADWVGAGIAQGFNDPWNWYAKHRDRIILHPYTRELVEELLFNYRMYIEQNNMKAT